jgi:hypothetical protein
LTAGRAELIGRRVRVAWPPRGVGVIDRVERQPGANVRVHHEDGTRCWYGLASLRSEDSGALPTEAEIRVQEDEAIGGALRQLLREHVARHCQRERWPWIDFGRAHYGRSLAEAIEEIEARHGRGGRAWWRDLLAQRGAR